MTRDEVEAFALSLPATSKVVQWGGSDVYKVGGKVFAICGLRGGLSFKVSEIAFEGLTGLPHVGQAPYFAKRQWVSVSKGAALSDAELKAYILASYQTIAGKLTRKVRAELGIAL